MAKLCVHSITVCDVCHLVEKYCPGARYKFPQGASLRHLLTGTAFADGADDVKPEELKP